MVMLVVLASAHQWHIPYGAVNVRSFARVLVIIASITYSTVLYSLLHYKQFLASMYLLYVRVFVRKLHYGLATRVAEPFGDIRGHTPQHTLRLISQESSTFT